MAGGRSVWQGTIALGAAQIPARLFIAASSRDVSLNMLHQHEDGSVSRVKQQFACEADGAIVERSAAARGYEHAKDQFVVLSEEEIATLRAPSQTTLELLAFVPAADVPAVYHEQAYSIAAEDAGRRAYALLQRLLADGDLVAVGKITMRDREQLCALRPLGGELLLWTLFYADEVRVAVDAPAVDVGFSTEELAMGRALVEVLRKPFDLHEHQDAYRASLGALVQTKLDGGEVKRPETAAASADAPQPLSLTEALRQTLERNGRGAKAKKPVAKKPAKPAAKRRSA